MGKQTLLVLGAGRDQKFLISTAKQMGLFVVAVDSDHDAVARNLCDVFAPISNRSVGEIVKFCQEDGRIRGRVDGVITMGSDIPDVVSSVAARLGAPHIPFASAVAARDKGAMKEALSAGGVRVPPYRLCRNKTEFRAAIGELGLPVVLKPLRMAGSKGVFLISDLKESATLWEKSSLVSGERTLLVEKFIDGPQISTESLIIERSLHTVGFADRNYDEMTRFLPQIMENGGWVPSDQKRHKEEIDEQLTRAASALDISNHTLKGDIVLGSAGPYVIEVAARLSGGDFCESLVPLHSGENYVEAAIDLCLGNKPDVQRYSKDSEIHVANRYFFAAAGQLLDRIEGLEEAERHPLVKKLEIWVKPGDYLPMLESHSARSGVFVIAATSRHEAEHVVEWVYDRVKFVMGA